MASGGASNQVVFLVDLSTGTREKDDDSLCEKTLNSIKLNTLRLLTHLAQSNKLLESLRWGYKFCNSVERMGLDRSGFQEFNLRNFEEFEERLESRFESERVKRENKTNREKNYKTVTDEFLIADDFGNYLKELLTDFQWDRPDVTSPVKSFLQRGRGQKKPILAEETKQRNIVVFFSCCPHTYKELQDFTCEYEQGCDVNSVLDSFLPSNVYREFYELSKIRLFWVDLASVLCNAKEEPDPDSLRGLQVIHQVLQSIDGGVIPCGAIQQLGKPPTTTVNSLIVKGPGIKHVPELSSAEEESTSENAKLSSAEEEGLGQMILPLSTVMQYYMTRLLPGPGMPLIDQEVAKGYLLIQNPLEPNWKENMLAHIRMRPMFLGNSQLIARHSLQESGNRVHGRKAASELVSLDVNSTRLSREGDTHRHCESFTVSCPQVSQEEQAPQETLLVVRGSIRSNTIPLSCLQSDLVYVITTHQEADNTLLLLLEYLVSHNLSLVVDFMDPRLKLLVSGVLQPLTSVSATLTFVRADLCMTLEKLLQFGGVPECKESYQAAENFMIRSVSHIFQNFSQKYGRKDEVVESKTGRKDQVCFNPALLERWVPATACTGSLDSLLRDIDSKETVSSEEESKRMKALQKFYRKKKSSRHTDRPAGAHENDPLCSPSKNLRRSPRKALRKSPKNTSPKQPLRRSPRKAVKMSAKDKLQSPLTIVGRTRSFTAPVSSRCTYIFKKSKEVVAQKGDDEDENGSGKKGKKGAKKSSNIPTNQVPVEDFKSSRDLLEHLKSCYDHCVEGAGPTLSCAQTMVNIALHYVKTTDSQTPLADVQNMFHKNLLLIHNQVRDKYNQPQSDFTTENKITEFQVQILLRMELESLTATDNVDDDVLDDKVQEVVAMLRALSFLRDTGFLTTYLNELLENYVETVPRMMYLIYEELLQPLPPQLATMFSPDNSTMPPSNASTASWTSDHSSVYNSVQEAPSVRSTRARRTMASFPSFNKGPQRQISIPGKAAKKDKEENVAKKRTRSSSRHIQPAVAKNVENGAKSEVRKVRRNLFTEVMGGGGKMERRQSVAVMEGLRGATPRTPSRANKRVKDLRTPNKGRPSAKGLRTPKSHHILKTKTVTETPAHKQKQNLRWRRQEKERRRAQTVDEVMVVQESPDKVTRELKKKDVSATSPRKKATLGLMKRKSFYMQAAESEARSQKYELLEARMASRNVFSPKQTKTCLRVGKDTSPRRIQPLCLFAQIASPSPPKAFTPSGTPSRAKRRITDCFDSPSKNTRSQGLMSPIRNVVHPLTFTNTPQKNMPQLNTPQKNTPQKGEILLSPRRSSRLDQIMMSPGRQGSRNILDTLKSPNKGGKPEQKGHARRITLGSPIKSPLRGLNTPVKSSPAIAAFQGFVANSPSASNVATTPLKAACKIRFGTPSKEPSSSDRFASLFNSPSRFTTPKKESPLTRNAALFLQSPNRMTRFQLKNIEDGGSVDVPSKKTDDHGNKNEFTGIKELCDKEKESEGSTKRKRLSTPEKTRVGNDLTSPRRSLRLFASPIKQGVNNENVEIRMSEKTPHEDHNKEQDNIEASTLKSADALPEYDSHSTGQSYSGQINLSPELKRKVSKKKGRYSRGKDSSTTPPPNNVENSRTGSEVENMNLGDIEGVSQSTMLEVMKTPSGKRKRSPMLLKNTPELAGDNALSGTPQKRRKVLKSRTENSCTSQLTFSGALSGNQSKDYFANQEVFLMGEQPEKTSNLCEDLSPSRYSLRRKSSQDSEASSGFILPDKGRLRHFLSGASDSNSNLTGECPVSPAIPARLQARKQSSGALCDFGDESDTSLTMSPVINSKIKGLISRLGEEDVVTGSPSKNISPVSNRGSPAHRNFSPSISTRSIAHLMSSPLISDASDSSPRSGTIGSPRKHKPQPPRSRRSLYRTETNAQL